MMRSFVFTIISVGCLLVPCPAQDGPLSLIPADAHVVLRVQAPDTTIDDLAAFANSVQEGTGLMIQGQKPSLGAAIRNPSMAGVDTSRDWFAVLTLSKERRPQTALVIPATDAAAMVGALEQSGMVTQTAGDWVAYARRAEELEAVKACASGQAKTLSLAGDFQAAMMAPHFAVHLNGAAVKELYEAEIDQLEAQWGGLVSMLVAQVQAASPQANVESIEQMYTLMGQTFFQVVRDSQSLLVTVNIDGENLEIGEMMTVAADSVSSRYLADQQTSDFAHLAALPNGLQGYMGMSVDLQPLMAWSKGLVISMLADTKMSDSLQEQLQSMEKWKIGEMCVGGGFTKEGGMQYLQRSEVSPADSIREFMKAFGDLGTITTSGIEQEYSYSRAAETVNGLEVDLLRIKQSVPESLDPTGMTTAILDTMYGEDGMEQRVAIAGDVVYQVVSGSVADLKQLIDGGGSGSAAYTATRSAHPEQLNVMVLMDLPSMIISSLKLAASVPQAGIPLRPEMLENMNVKESYIGFSLVAKPNQLNALTTIPAETLRGFFTVFLTLQRVG